MKENKKWYVLYTRRGRERKVAENLSRKRIENYCPFNTVMQQLSLRKKLVKKPLFSSYVFVRIYENQIPDLSQINGISFLFWLGKPAVIHDWEIKSIKRFLEEYASVKLEKIDIKVSVHADVITTGNEIITNAMSCMDEKNEVILPSLGYAIIAEVREVVGAETLFNFRNYTTGFRMRIISLLGFGDI